MSVAAFRYFAAIVEEANDLIAAIDLEHRYVVCNQAYREAFESLFGICPHGGDRLEDVLARMPAKQRKVVARMCRKALSGKQTIVTADFGARTYEIAHRPLRDETGRVFGVSQIAHDMSARVAYEETLRVAAKRRSDFLSVIAHELRNPLAAVRYALAVIKRVTPGGPASRAVEAMERQVRQLSRLVDDLLDVGRISRGKLTLQKEHVDLRGVVRTAVEAVSYDLGERDVQASVPDAPVWLRADPARLGQVVTNLLHNAVKFTGRGGHVEVKVACEDHFATMTVRDDGIGFEPQNGRALFGMFWQANKQEDHGGMGIGLSLAKQLVEMHGGTIEARSEGIGHGAEFIVRLPVANSPQ